jgi:hypothetical protein
MKMKKRLLMGVFSLALLLPTSVFADTNGNITPFTSPTTEYTSNTNKIDFSNLSNYANYDSITDGTQTISFSTQMEKRKIPDHWNAQWSPATEEQNPHILFSNYHNEVTLNLSQPTTTFGFEFGTNSFGTYSYTVDYFSGTTLIGSLTQSITNSPIGNQGDIKVFGATSDAPFDRVVIRSVSGDTSGFSIAQIRYGTILNQDNIAPESIATLSVIKNRLNIVLSGTDDQSGVEKTEYRINGGNWVTYTAPVSLNFNEQLQFRSIDIQGNVEEARTIGLVENGYQLENVYIQTSKGLEGPINKTMKTGQEMLLYILTLSR